MASRGRHRPNHPERQRRAHQVREKPPSHHGKGRLSSGRHMQLTTTHDNRYTHRREREREGMHDDVLLLLADMYIYVCVMFCVHAGSEQRTGLGQEDRRGEAVEWSVWASAGELHLRASCVHCRGGHCWKQVGRGREGGGRGRGVKDVISPAPLHRLFHVIVDTDRTASQILSIMNKQKLPGEVTFLPLNKLNPPTVDYPNAKNVCEC